MKITNQGIVPLDSLKSDKGTTSARQSSVASSADEQVAKLSDLGRSASDTYDSLSSQDEIDMDKVLAMRSAIEKGQLALDENALVNAILDMHRL